MPTLFMRQFPGYAAKPRAPGGVTVVGPNTPAQATEVLKRENERFLPPAREGMSPLG